MGHLVTDTDSNTPKKVSAVGHRDKNTMTVFDCRSGHTFLVDCGADFSVFSASKADKAALPQGDPLMAANGSLIRVWGKKTVTLRLGSDRSFTQEFYIAEVTEPILGADFFINNDLAIDMNRRRPISMADLAPIPTKMAERIPSVTGIHAPPANTSDRIIAEFAKLLIPRFKPSNEESFFPPVTMRSALPMPLKYHGKHPEYTPNNLAETGYVYVRHDAHRGLLQRPYKGPFKILDMAKKHFTLKVNGHPHIVSIDRLKTAYGIVPPMTLSPPPPANSPVMTQSSTPAIV